MIKLDCGAYFAYEQIGRFSLTEEWRHPRRIIKSHELIVVLEGILYINEGGVFYELKKGDALLLEPGLLHYGTRSVSEPVSFFWLHFRTDLPMPFKTAVGQELHDLNYILRKLLHAGCRNACCGNCFVVTFGCYNLKSVFCKASCYIYYFFFVFSVYGNQYGTF